MKPMIGMLLKGSWSVCGDQSSSTDRFITGGAQAAAPSPAGADQSAIRGVISDQIEAFRHDDGTAAFGFAAPNIQAMFGTVDNFMGMVRRGYPPVYRPKQVTFGALAEEDGRLVQIVHLVGPDGHPVD